MQHIPFLLVIVWRTSVFLNGETRQLALPTAYLVQFLSLRDFGSHFLPSDWVTVPLVCLITPYRAALVWTGITTKNGELINL
jgi:hypothetical protein